MNREQAKEQIKNRLEEYLQSRGLNPRKPFCCLNPEHSDSNPSMSYDRKRQKVHCFSCGCDYDTFDLIGIDYGLSENKDIFKKAYELFNIEIDSSGTGQGQNQPKNGQYTHNNIHTLSYTQTDIEEKPDYTPYYKECQSRINETNYPQSRGLTEETIKRFMLGYEPNYNKGTGGEIWQALIIPTGKSNYIARNTAPNAEKKQRYRKNGGSVIYNRRALKEADKPIFVVEGEIDALSIIEVGGFAVALGSTANSRAFIKLIEAAPPTQPLLLCLDNDTEGQNTTDYIAGELTRLKAPFYRVDIYGDSKDANEALTKDRESFTSTVRGAENIEQAAQEEAKENYIKTSAAHHLQSFINGIADSVNTPYIPTGFAELDNILDGGLFEGLYILGAISSLGKTTLVMQIADQIAERKTDVLIFSLEMARTEIMAKSISRLTLLDVLQNSGNIQNAKTTRGITTGSRWINYSREEKNLINRAITTYGAYADNIYICEGVGDIGAEQIREQVKQHITFTGKRPVVIIDYVQILSPADIRATDKQNIDKSVLELKRISREFKIPIIGISSLNRANYNTPISMEALKESGSIEYGSDVIIGLQLKGAGKKEFDVNAAKQKNPRDIEAVILKNRNGATGGRIRFEYYPLFNYFKEA